MKNSSLLVEATATTGGGGYIDKHCSCCWLATAVSKVVLGSHNEVDQALIEECGHGGL